MTVKIPEEGTLLRIFIGEETGLAPLDACTVVTAPYGANGRVLGVLGVIGPTRMAYERVIPMVQATADVLGAALNPGRSIFCRSARSSTEAGMTRRSRASWVSASSTRERIRPSACPIVSPGRTETYSGLMRRPPRGRDGRRAGGRCRSPDVKGSPGTSNPARGRPPGAP